MLRPTIDYSYTILHFERKWLRNGHNWIFNNMAAVIIDGNHVKFQHHLSISFQGDERLQYKATHLETIYQHGQTQVRAR